MSFGKTLLFFTFPLSSNLLPSIFQDFLNGLRETLLFCNMSINIRGMVVAFLLLLALVGISSADTVYTWYYGKQLASFLQAMNSYISSVEFVDLWKVVTGFAFILLLFAVIASAGNYRQSLRLLQFYGLVIVVWYLLVVIKTPVDVVDICTKTTYSNIQAPWAVAKPLSWFTTIERNVRNGLVSFFGIFLPDAYKQNEGCFTGYELLRPALTYQPKDPYLRLSIENYIKDCIIPTIMAGDIDRFALVNSNDLWNNEFVCNTGKLCVALTTTYYSSTNPEGIVDSCPNAYTRINADIVNEYSRAWKDIKVKVFGTASAISETDIPIYLGEITPFLMSVSLTGENLIRQAITIQSFGRVSAEFATAVAYQEAYLNALSRLNMLDFGRGGTLNAMKGVIETLLVGLTPAFVLLFITPIGGRIFYGWVTFFVWLALWSIAEVVTVSFLFLSIGDNQKFDFTLSQIDKINLTFNKAAQISSLMSDYIPLITLAIATGSLYAMTHFAKGMSRELRDEHGTKVMSSGNLDVGNVRARGYSDLAQTLATSSVGDVRWDTAQAKTWMGNTLGMGNTTTSQYNGYDPKLRANLSGAWENPNTFVGKVEGGTYSGQGRWDISGNQAKLLHGTAQVATPVTLEQITGGQISGLRNAEVRMANGRLVYARGIDEMTGAEVIYSRSSDGIETMTYNYGAWTAKLMKDKNGEWKVVGGSGPIDMNVVQRYVENLENSKAQMDKVATAFRSSEGISNADSQTFNAGYRLAYDIAQGKGGASEYERGFARDLIKYTGLKALETLGKEGYVRKDGEKISAEEAQRKGGIRLGIPKDIAKKLPFGIGIDTVIMTKDGWVVKDNKGQYWFFKRTEEESKAIQDAWKTTVSGQSKDFFNYRENTTNSKYTSEDFRKDLTAFRNRASEYAATRSKEIGKKISFTKQNARDINARATQLLISDYLNKIDGEDIKDKTGKALTELNHLVSTPQGIKELMEVADKVVDNLMEDKKLEKPQVNEQEVITATDKAETEGAKAKNTEVQGPSKDTMQVYQQTKRDIEEKADNMGKEYQQNKKAIDIQKRLYDKYVVDKDGFNTFKNSIDQFYNNLKVLANLQGKEANIGNKIEELQKEKEKLEDKVSKAEKEWFGDILTLSSLGPSVGDIMQIVTDEDKLKKYEEEVKNKPTWEQANYIDPAILRGLHERWKDILKAKSSINILDTAIEQSKGDANKTYELIKKQIEKIRTDNKDGMQFSIAQDMFAGNYSVSKDKDILGTKQPSITTKTEEQLNDAFWKRFRIRPEDIDTGVTPKSPRGGI